MTIIRGSMNRIEIVSAVLGWIYTVCWSASFYPQVIMNFQRKDLTGFSIDFAALNVLGFGSYTIYTVMFLASREIRREYRTLHPDENLVKLNDFIFAAHGFLLTVINIFQCFCLGYKRKESLHPRTIGVLVGSLFATFLVFFLRSQPIWMLYALSYVKMLVTLLKYMPQVYKNYLRQSTKGFAILAFILDFTGGILSMGQLLLDAYEQGSFDGIVGNSVKFGLGFVSIVFDLIFFVQHYLLYRHPINKALCSD